MPRPRFRLTTLSELAVGATQAVSVRAPACVIMIISSTLSMYVPTCMHLFHLLVCDMHM